MAIQERSPTLSPQPGAGDLLQTLKAKIRWSLSLGNKLRRKAPWPTAMCVLTALTSQMAMLAAFLLPLKVIMLLGSGKVPKFLPPELAGMGHETLIVLLSCASIVFYGLNLLSENMGKLALNRGVKQLIASSGKMVLFEDQDEIASTAYKQYTTALAGGLFVCLALVLQLWLYPAIPLLLIIYLSLLTLLVTLAVRNATLRNQIENNLLSWIPVFTSLAFLLVFAGMVADFLIGTPPAFTPAIVALLLTRQLTNKSKSAITSLAKLLRQQTKIDALFFQRAVVLTETPQEKTIWPLLLPQARKEWVPQVLAEMLGKEWAEPAAIHWWSSGQLNIGMLHCTYPDRTGVLLKLYESNRANQALHEATLLGGDTPTRAFPKLLGTTELNGFHCHALQVPLGARPVFDISESRLVELRQRLLAIQLPKQLITRYCRSHPQLGQRLSLQGLQRLFVTTREADEQQLNKLLQRLQVWRDQLHKMPLCLSVKAELPNLIENDAGELMLLHWGNWALEPCGFDWPCPEALQPAVAAAAAQLARNDLTEIPGDLLRLVVLSASLERNCAEQQYGKAVQWLGPLNECLDQLEKSPLVKAGTTEIEPVSPR